MVLIGSHNQKESYPRLKAVSIILVAAFFILLFRLWYLQILKGDIYLSYSNDNRITKFWIPATRGKIFDRNNNILVDSRPSFDLTITRGYTKNYEETLTKLNEWLMLDRDDFNDVVKKVKSERPYRSVTIARDISKELVSLVEVNQTKEFMNGVSVEPTPIRNYRLGDNGAHFLGYLREVDDSGLKRFNENKKESEKYRPGNYIGTYGLEKKYEHVLRGIDGIKPVEVDVKGRIIGEASLNVGDLSREFERGSNVITTIDRDVQEAAYQSFSENESGSIVAMNPQNGEILAIVSYPAFNPDIFSTSISTKKWKKLSEDLRRPLIDKVVQGLYPPGSTFKIAVAVAALESGLVSLDTKVTCPGYLMYKNRKYRCHKDTGHGSVNIIDAIRESCDVFFYTMGIKIGIDRISHYAHLLNLGTLSGLDLNEEKKGLVPSSEWKMRVKKEKWWGGETLSAAIGQSYNQVTAMQLAMMMMAVANRGKLYVPTLIKGIETYKGDDADLNDYYFPPPQLLKEFTLKQSTWDAVQTGLFEVVNNPRGTAYYFGKSKRYSIAGKTGTAQVIEQEEDQKITQKVFQDHALFVAYAPSENPQIVVAVIVENGGHGSSMGAPKAKKVIETYLDKQTISLLGNNPTWTSE